jgi:hypothetical protein
MSAEERMMRILSYLVDALSLCLAIVLFVTAQVKPLPFSVSELNRQIASADRLSVRYVDSANKLVSYSVDDHEERQVLQELISSQKEFRRSNAVIALEPRIRITPESNSFLASKTIGLVGDQLNVDINGEKFSINIKTEEAHLRLLLRNFLPAPQLQKIRAVAISSPEWKVTYGSAERAKTAKVSNRMLISELSELIQAKQQGEFRYYQYGPSGGVPIAIQFSRPDGTGTVTQVHIIRDVMFANINQLNYRVYLESENLYESLIEICTKTGNSSVE